MEKSPKIKIAEDIYCYNVDEDFRCAAFNRQHCKPDCSARIGSLRQLLKLYRGLLHGSRGEAGAYIRRISEIQKEISLEEDKQIRAAYNEDLHRGSKGGSSESDSNNRASLKQRMKDNRSQECKPTRSQREELKSLTEQWEAENEKLPKLSRSMLSRKKTE